MRTKQPESNITVAVRVRPLIEREKRLQHVSNVRVEDNLIICLDPKSVDMRLKDKKKHDVLSRSREQKYAFDDIFTQESAKIIFDKTVSKLISPVLDGFNGCVFAYGATGTGKTYTMLGGNGKKGLCDLTLESIFNKIDTLEYQEKIFTLKVCYVEIYNEKIKDLLCNDRNADYLDLRDDPVRGVTIAGAMEVIVDSAQKIMQLLSQGNKRRTTEATKANSASSRSHAIFQVVVTGKSKTRGINIEQTVGKLSLIDLAGSERGTVTENRGIRLREGAKINQSLLALANCINALGDSNKKGSFVPYRDSKLTRMLKDSLGGNCKTIMIVTVSPSAAQYEETVNTLKYANRAKNIKCKPIENKKLVELHIAEYKNVISELRFEVDELKSKLRKGTNTNREKDKKTKEEEETCKCGRKEDEAEVKLIQEELITNFGERIQLRRGLCELEAQNQLNMMEIQRGQKEMMRYTLSQSGNLVMKSIEEEGSIFDNLPPHLAQQLSQINTLKVSMDLNQKKKDLMKNELKNLSKQARTIMDHIPQRVKHQDKRKFLELVVKNHFLELENNEHQFNLKLQEKMNKILKKELSRLKDIMRKNNLPIDDEDSEDELEIEQYPVRKEKENSVRRKRKQKSPNSKRDRPGTEIQNRNFKKKTTTSSNKYRSNPRRKTDKRKSYDEGSTKFPKIKNLSHERLSQKRKGQQPMKEGLNTLTQLQADIKGVKQVINQMEVPKRIQDRIDSNKGELFSDMAIKGNKMTPELAALKYSKTGNAHSKQRIRNKNSRGYPPR